MSNKVITISREFGSGGRTIGKQLAAKLGIPCYDSELLEKIAEQSGFAKEYIAEHGEYAAGGSWLAQAFSYRDNKGHSYQDDLWGFQQKVITELAEQGSCVIVGRCADYILKDKADFALEFSSVRIWKAVQSVLWSNTVNAVILPKSV